MTACRFVVVAAAFNVGLTATVVALAVRVRRWRDQADDAVDRNLRLQRFLEGDWERKSPPP